MKEIETSGESKKLVLVVDDNSLALDITREALSDLYTVATVLSAKEMFEFLEHTKPELILLDIDMPEMNGFEAMRLLKRNSKYNLIPVSFLTANDDPETELEGLNLGAVDYIYKPYRVNLFRQRVRQCIHAETQRRTLEAQARMLGEQSEKLKNFHESLKKIADDKRASTSELQTAVLGTLSELVKGAGDFSAFTEQQTERIQRGLSTLITALKERGIYVNQIDDWDLPVLIRSAALYDIGKFSLGKELTEKPGKLTQEEFDKVKLYPEIGTRLIERIDSKVSIGDLLEYADVFAGTHHEKWDGSGYPYGLSGESIPLLGRLMAIVDVYCALTSDRPQRKAMSHNDALLVIAEGKGTHFDPVIADVFIEIADQLKI